MARAKGKEHPHNIFLRRLRRENRFQQYQQRVRQLLQDAEQAGETLYYSQATKQARGEFGYAGPKEERRLEEESKRSPLLEKLVDERDVIREEMKAESYDDALRWLPDSAPGTDEVAWIRAHPAMSRMSRRKASTEPIVISPDDILTPPHGPAPSKAAVHALQYWANHPQKFFEKVLTEQNKKGTEDEKESSVDSEEDLAEIERLLKSVRAD